MPYLLATRLKLSARNSAYRRNRHRYMDRRQEKLQTAGCLSLRITPSRQRLSAPVCAVSTVERTSIVFFTAELFYSVIQRQETSLSLSVTYALHVGGRTEPEEVGPPPLLRSRLRRPLSPKTGEPPLAVLCVCRRG